MRVITATNPAHALAQGINLLWEEGDSIDSRNGPTIEYPGPVTTIYPAPENRVMLWGTRNANPFFHLFESLWILAGRRDVGFLTEFNKRMADYSDDGQVFNAAYGYRIREHFNLDQLKCAISNLQNNPGSRQEVLKIWDSEDLSAQTKDKACNLCVVFRARNNVLSMTVYNRSNDIIWGAYGANVVQFSMLHEYVAAKVGMEIGEYYQVSNSYHAYLTGPGGELWKKLFQEMQKQSGTEDTLLVPYECIHSYDSVENRVFMCTNEMDKFDGDLKSFFTLYDGGGLEEVAAYKASQSEYFKHLVMPMLRTFIAYKQKDRGPLISSVEVDNIVADDWRFAALAWITR